MSIRDSLIRFAVDRLIDARDAGEDLADADVYAVIRAADAGAIADRWDDVLAAEELAELRHRLGELELERAGRQAAAERALAAWSRDTEPAL